MIWYITGKPRSGKTYYAVDRLVHFAKSDRYDHIYTNIAGFKFDKFENVKKLDFEFFFDDYIKILYDEFKKAKKTMEDYDDHIVNKVKEDGYYKSAFFVDECQEYLSNDRAHLKWLFSYQGHLGFDFYFITQALGLVHSKYKYTVESVTNSVSSSNKIFANLLSSPILDKLFGRFKLFKKIRDYSNYGVYQIYASTKMTRADKISTFRKVFRPDIFAYYKSGDKVKTTSPIMSLVLVILSLILGLFVYYKYFFVSGNFPSQDSTVGSSSKDRSDSRASRRSQKKKHGKDSSILDDNLLNDGSIIVSVRCNSGYCSSSFFAGLPYKLFTRLQEGNYKIVYYHRHMYGGMDIYIKTTESVMHSFSDLLPNDRRRKKKSASPVEKVLDDLR